MAQEVIVHEAWSVHMESAGGWIAAEKGFDPVVGITVGHIGREGVQRVAAG